MSPVDNQSKADGITCGFRRHVFPGFVTVAYLYINIHFLMVATNASVMSTHGSDAGQHLVSRNDNSNEICATNRM